MNPKMYEYSFWLKVDEQTGVEMVHQALAFSGHTVVNGAQYTFEPQGYTCLWLLAESHLAVHTYPEHNALYVQLSSCSKEKAELFMQAMHNGNPMPTKTHEHVSDLFSVEN